MSRYFICDSPLRFYERLMMTPPNHRQRGHGYVLKIEKYAPEEVNCEYCFPCTKEARQQFDGAVMNAYQQALTQVQSQSQRSAPDPFQQKSQTQTM